MMRALWFGCTVTEEPSQALCATGRRSKLPVSKPETPDISLWNLLYRNIGKDLTKISMPVTLNEPLSMLQVTNDATLRIFFFFFFFFCLPPIGGVAYVTVFNSSASWAATFNLRGYKCMLVIFVFS